jgi:hypothetical protein
MVGYPKSFERSLGSVFPWSTQGDKLDRLEVGNGMESWGKAMRD